MSNEKQKDRHKKYKLSKHAYLTALHYALQYDDWQKELGNNTCGIPPIVYDDMPHAPQTTSDRTSDSAIKRVELSEKIDTIERIAKESAGSYYPYLLYAVTHEDVTYPNLQMVHDIPCSRSTFYRMRRRFFYELSKNI